MTIDLEDKQAIQAALYPWILFSLLGDEKTPFGNACLMTQSKGAPCVVYDPGEKRVSFESEPCPKDGASFGFQFASLKQAIAFFEQSKLSVTAFRGFRPMTWGRFLSKLLKIQGQMSASNWERLSEEQLVTKSLFLLKAAVYGIQGLAQLNPFSRSMLEHVPKGCISVRVGDGAPLSSIVFREGGIEWVEGAAGASGRSVDFIFKDERCAWLSAANLTDNLAAVGKGDIRLAGYVPLADGFNHLLDRLQIYVKN
jgi:hypothetical protein